MKELDSFTIERLGEIKNAFLDCNKETAPSIGEIFALIDIALAAKRAEPDYYIVRLKFNDGWGDETVLDTYETELDATKSKADHGGDIIPVYLTPQLNSPQGWIKCSDQMPEDCQTVLCNNMLTELSGIPFIADYVGMFDLHDGTRYEAGFYVNRTPQTVTHWMPLPPAPEKENG